MMQVISAVPSVSSGWIETCVCTTKEIVLGTRTDQCCLPQDSVHTAPWSTAPLHRGASEAVVVGVMVDHGVMTVQGRAGARTKISTC